MSNIYISEPPTKGKVLLVTTLGEFDIELWSKEAPLACRNFVQLCMEKYYNGTIFHRVVRNFCAQGGDPTGTGEGGESIYGSPFKDEFHQRLKFTRRGLVAMANGGRNDNGSQFFFTLDRADELNNKHTIFGKVTGHTLYNLPKFNDLQTDKEDRPSDAPKIIKAEILSNPFEDIVPRDIGRRFVKAEKQKPQSQSKATKDFGLLSFGDEAEEEEEEMEAVSKDMKIKSSHDVLSGDPNLSSQPAVENDSLQRKSEEDMRNDNGNKDGGFDPDPDEHKKLKRQHLTEQDSDEPSSKEPKTTQLDDIRREVQKLRKELQKDKKKKEEVKKKEEEEEGSDVLKEYKAERAKYLTRGQMKKLGMSSGEDKTQKALDKFRKKLKKVRKSSTSIDEEEEEDTEHSSWLVHRLVFAEEGPVVAKDANVKNMDTYDIYDPRNPLTKRRREKK